MTNNNKRNKRVHIYINKTACKLKDIIEGSVKWNLIYWKQIIKKNYKNFF